MTEQLSPTPGPHAHPDAHPAAHANAHPDTHAATHANAHPDTHAATHANAHPDTRPATHANAHPDTHAAAHAELRPHVRPLVHPVHVPGHPHPRRPVRHPHQSGEAPRVPRNPRAACAPARPYRPRTPAPTTTRHADLAARFAHRLVEVLTGTRPVHQLQRHTTLPGFHQLAALVRTGPLRPRGRTSPFRLGRVHDSVPAPGALEACVRVEFGPRHHMLAFRLEQHTRTGQWQCSAVEAR
ncbi:Rv3235 family protein [Kitasatospora sp. NPDC049285]|uniref:Rv3235 family protein n=1 Tax=Kitasatospora sp. NPDC049285 TaxID=3157096 RepID=UPI0034339794